MNLHTPYTARAGNAGSQLDPSLFNSRDKDYVGGHCIDAIERVPAGSHVKLGWTGSEWISAEWNVRGGRFY